MPTHCITIDLANQGRRKVRACFDGGRMSSDGGALLLQAVDQRIGLTRRLAACFSDHRDPRRCEHSLPRLIAQRLFGLALGYEDLNDHDRLRDDSLLALALGSDDLSGERRARERDRGHPLAGSSTLNRLELGLPEQAGKDRYKRIVADTERLDALLVELFLDRHAEAPEEIVLDVDATDDPLHGQQEGRFFHGYYDSYCYLPLYVTCGPHVLCGRLRPSNRDAAAGTLEELERIVEQIRERWPQVRVVVRGDSGFCREELMAWCEGQAGVDYVFGLAKNPRLKRAIEQQQRRSRSRGATLGQAWRRYRDFRYRTLASWSRKRRVVGKAEWLPGRARGDNQRFVVTSLERGRIGTQALYEQLYCARGDMENRIKEQQLGLFADRSNETLRGAAERYRGLPHREKAYRQIDRELAVIAKLQLEGYFLIVWDMVEFARRSGILCQGRGSAANSAVCYSLGITAVDPVGMDLLFERFLSEERGEWPDIDIDLPSGDQRERVIQHVYERYGQRGVGMTANVITYRGKSAVREMGKVLSFPEELIGRLAKGIHGFEYVDSHDDLLCQAAEAGLDRRDLRVGHWLRLCLEIQGLPRHLGQHSGGMVICQGDLDAVVPLENARMPGRVVVQWDKEDCADLGIIKVDLLGLGMMAALEESTAIIRSRGGSFDLARIPPDDPKTYAMIQRADTVGVFQIESRAQMATLPRIKPACFYDLVVEVAIIRPGPITGNMVHPYINRRLGREPVRYAHPSLEPILKRTLGVPLFQEQLLRMAMTAATFTGGQAEQLRRAMGFKRSVERMSEIEARLRQGLSKNGIGGNAAEEIVRSIKSFALYGFPESHSASFALLAYASSYLKAHYPAEFLASLLNCQPMGFYSPAVLVKDAQRHGVRVLPIDVNESDRHCTVGDLPGPPAGAVHRPASCVRLGLIYVGDLRAEAAARIVEDRALGGRFRSIGEFARRVRLQKSELDVLAEIGAFNSVGDRIHRREALWQVESAWRPKGPLFNRQDDAPPAPGPLAPMQPLERLEADYRGTGLTVGKHPMHYLRGQMAGMRVLSSREVEAASDGQRVRVAGAVITRQRPGTAKGFCFITLEDETGVSNLILSPQVFQAHRFVVMHETFVLAEGILQNTDGTAAVKTEVLQPFSSPSLGIESHDFH